MLVARQLIMDLYIRKTWAQPNIVVSLMVRFERKFGPDAFRLACHCSVLPAVWYIQAIGVMHQFYRI